MIAILVKNNEVSDYPADLLINNKIIKCDNLEYLCMNYNIRVLCGKSLPSSMIKKLRDKGINFLKINSLEEINDIDLDIILPLEFKNKRGWRCGKKGF